MFGANNITTDLLSRIIGQDPTGRDYVHRVQQINGLDSYGNPIVLGDMEDLMATGDITPIDGSIPSGGYMAPAGSQDRPAPINQNLDTLATNDAARDEAAAQQMVDEAYAQIIADEQRTQASQIDDMVGPIPMPGAPTGLYPEEPSTWDRVVDVFNDPRREGQVDEGIDGETPVNYNLNGYDGGTEDPFTNGDLTFGIDPRAPQPTGPDGGAVTLPSSQGGNAAPPDPAVAAQVGADPETGLRDDQTRASSILERLIGEEGSDRRASMGQALMAAGASIMSTGGSLGEAIGAGIQSGMITYTDAMQALKDEEIAMRELQMDEEAHAIEMEMATLALERARAAPVGGSGASGDGDGDGTGSMDGDLGDLFATEEGAQIYNLAQDLITIGEITGNPISSADAIAAAQADEGAYIRSSQQPDDEVPSWMTGAQ